MKKMTYNIKRRLYWFQTLRLENVNCKAGKGGNKLFLPLSPGQLRLPQLINAMIYLTLHYICYFRQTKRK